MNSSPPQRPTMSAFADGRLERRPDGREHLVALAVSVVVFDLFEVVEVEVEVEDRDAEAG